MNRSRIKGRYLEIDFLRGVGIILMLISNFVTDIQIFLDFQQNIFWKSFAIFTASIFVYTSGATFYVNYTLKRSFKRILKRFTKLMGIGLIITLITASFLKEGTIYFGILHFLALAWIIAVPFYYLRARLAALFFIVFYPLITSIHAETLLLLPLGITPSYFYTLDYFPIFPWFGIFLLGFDFGEKVMKEKKLKIGRIKKLVCSLGKHSLKIYLIHQPVFVTIILLFFGGKSGILNFSFPLSANLLLL